MMELNTVTDAGCPEPVVDTDNSNENQHTNQPYVGGSLPAELRNEPRWVVARIPSKVPLCAFDPSRNADSTKPSTWADFDAAQRAIERDPRIVNGIAARQIYTACPVSRCPSSCLRIFRRC